MVHPFSSGMARKEKSSVVWAEVVLKNGTINKDKGRQKLQFVRRLSICTLEDVCA